MNEDFVQLVNDEYRKLQNGEDRCFYIGEGNPDADILIVGNECAIDDNDPRLIGKIPDGCPEDKRRACKERIIAEDNVRQWHAVLGQKDVEVNIRRELPDYKDSPHNRYYPLFPWFGQKCIVRSQKRQRGEDGTARTWVQYQKLTDRINEKIFNRNNPIDFHLHAFHTELSQIPREHSGAKNTYTEESIDKRLKDLFCQPFFRKFPVVVIAAGHYVRDYKINIEEFFKVDFRSMRYVNDDRRQWINLHHGQDNDMPRLLIHTRHFAGCISDECILAIAELARQYIQTERRIL